MVISNFMDILGVEYYTISGISNIFYEAITKSNFRFVFGPFSISNFELNEKGLVTKLNT